MGLEKTEPSAPKIMLITRISMQFISMHIRQSPDKSNIDFLK